MNLLTKTYFISDGECVKIGKSANPEQRLEQLQTAHSKTLSLLWTIVGDFENTCHKIFDNARISGEWFQLSRVEWFLSLSSLERERFVCQKHYNLVGDLRLDSRYGLHNVLLCPYCNNGLEDYQHFGTPVVLQDRIHIPIHGECGHNWIFVFQFHAGNTWLGAMDETDSGN